MVIQPVPATLLAIIRRAPVMLPAMVSIVPAMLCVILRLRVVLAMLSVMDMQDVLVTIILDALAIRLATHKRANVMP
jgi:hypothetical protein